MGVLPPLNSARCFAPPNEPGQMSKAVPKIQVNAALPLDLPGVGLCLTDLACNHKPTKRIERAA